MKIGLIIYGSLDTVSGGYLYDRQLVRYLREAGEQVEIISLPWTAYGRHLLHNFSSPLKQRLCDTSFDVLLQDELNHPSLFLLNRQLNGRYPIISIVHHLRCSEARPAWQNRLYRQVERRYLASVDGFVFNSETTRRVTEDVLGERELAIAKQQRPFVVATPAANHHNQFITHAQIQQRALANGPLRLLFVGNLISRKGLHVLLQALASLPAADYQLTIVGSTETDPEYTQKIEQQLVGIPNVALLGSLSDAQLAKQFANHHVLVVPSSYEGFGIVYLEGMGFGLTAVGTTAGAAGEIITHGRNGFLIEPDDVASLAAHLQTLQQNRDKLAEMSVAAREHFLTQPTWGDSIGRIHRFLQQMS
ncbi:MAG: glycosyltransferase family 4 protein [Chloroflexota bacterium]